MDQNFSQIHIRWYIIKIVSELYLSAFHDLKKKIYIRLLITSFKIQWNQLELWKKNKIELGPYKNIGGISSIFAYGWVYPIYLNSLKYPRSKRCFPTLLYSSQSYKHKHTNNNNKKLIMR